MSWDLGCPQEFNVDLKLADRVCPSRLGSGVLIEVATRYVVQRQLGRTSPRGGSRNGLLKLNVARPDPRSNDIACRLFGESMELNR